MTAEAPEDIETVDDASIRKRPRPLDSLTAASTRLTRKNFDRFAQTKGKSDDDWQTEARTMYHLVGELRFLSNMLANRVGQGRLHVARLSDDPTADPDPIPTTVDDLPEGVEAPSDADLAAVEAFASFGNSPLQRTQMLTRAAINLFVPGDGWFVGTPPDVEASLNPPAEQTTTLVQGPAPMVEDTGPELDLTTLTWRYLSTAEVAFNTSATEVTIKIGDAEKGQWSGNPDRVLMFRCWRPDPFEWWTADSPVRASLPVLRRLVGLEMASSSQLDSRLAGAGIFLVPQSAKDAVLAAAGPQAEGQDDDPFTEAVMEAMLTPISDRSNASALVPLILTVPDETIEKFKHLRFSSDLDNQYLPLSENGIRRLALSLDAPPEALTGVGGMNHWGAWLVKEDTVTSHVEPPLAVVCDAATTQFLWPVLEAGGMDPETAHRYVVWYSVEHLIVRPNRFDDAKAAHAAGAMTDAALLRYGGFDGDDAPERIDDPAVVLALDLVRADPSLAAAPGLPALVEQIRSVINGTPAPPVTPDPAADPSGAATEGPPATDGAPAEPAIAASGLRQDGWSIGEAFDRRVQAVNDALAGDRVHVP